jgi:hypothetical protein
MERITVLEDLLRLEAKKIHRGDLQLVVSSQTVKALMQLLFHSGGDLEKGVNLFNTVYLARDKHSSSVTSFNDQDQWINGSAVASLTDYKNHEKFKHAVMPKTASQFRNMVVGYYVYLRVLFGEDHPLTERYAGLMEIVEELSATLEKWSEPFAYERCLFGLHSRIDAYFQDVKLPGSKIDGAHLPDLVGYAAGIRHRNPLPMPDWIKPPDTTSLKSKKEDPEKEPKEKKKGPGITEKNPDRKHETSGRVAQIIQARGVPPKHDDGSEMCLIFHTKPQGCKTTCERKHSHRKLTETEAKKLTEYLEGASTNQE